MKKSILPALLNETEFRQLSGAAEYTPIETLTNHYMVYYVKSQRRGWALLQRGAVPFKEFHRGIHDQALANLGRLTKTKVPKPKHIYKGDHAVIVFNEKKDGAIPMRTSVLDSRLMMSLLAVNFNVSLKWQTYYLGWAPFENMLIVTQDPRRLMSVAKEHKLEFNLESPILSVTVPASVLEPGQPFQANYSDIIPSLRTAH
ncbi:hypothetical protein N9L66_00705 [Porticoccaceae bacterium]|nr:hypothetical protein [Porticoccaceae bacterium]MDA8663467.1 hypothetical protein [Porticoccaceae bacterium]MDA8788823.1 hypothetical protein [Porticoccaceae bacterium]MDB2343177.1 hypothetical protein [Porticoccaceae bacterium]MDB2664979.1 hypothetical protein [Porticoccaceae bacterium]